MKDTHINEEHSSRKRKCQKVVSNTIFGFIKNEKKSSEMLEK
jgi:hypothetical protein